MEGPALAKDEKETLYEKKDVLLEEEIIYPHESPLLEIDGQRDEEEKMTIAVRELDQNTNFDWNQIQESGQEVEPIFGPGCIGLINLGNSFKFGIEDRITCTSGKVVYNRRLDYILSLYIPLHEATNKEELAAFQKLKPEKISEGKKSENNEIESDKLSANEDIVSQLVSMGCNHLHCQKAAIHTSNVGVQDALNWLLSYMDDSDIDARITQEAYGVVDQSKLGMLLQFGFQEDVGLEEEVFKKGHLHGEIVSLKASMGKEIVLPSLVHLFHSADERMLSSASNTLVGMLKLHNQKVEVICLLLDCLSALNSDVSKIPGDLVEESKVRRARLLKLIPEWARTVQEWNMFIGPLMDRMFAEPSNAVIVRFLSMISHHFVKAADEVFCHILSYVKEQKTLEESFFDRSNRGNYTSEFSLKIQQSLFERLCPLLIIRMLPLEVFNDRNLSAMYAKLPKQVVLHDIDDFPYAAALLLNKAFAKSAFEGVRELAAEFGGHLHLQVLFLQISQILKYVMNSHDILRIKVCLFSICISIMIRGRILISYTVIFEILKNLEMVLLWPSFDADEVSSAQHGCIDCLALMVCTEVQALNLSKDTLPKKINNDIVQEIECDKGGTPLATQRIEAANDASKLRERQPLGFEILLRPAQKKILDPGLRVHKLWLPTEGCLAA